MADNEKDIDEITDDLPDKADRIGYFGVTVPAHLHGIALTEISGIASGEAAVTEALKAHNQWRRTLMALADLGNPKRTTFIKQQNNAVNQQVNNEADLVNTGQMDSADQFSKSESLEKNESNELMGELSHVQRMDARKASEAV